MIDATTGDPEETTALASAARGEANRLRRCHDCRIERASAARRGGCDLRRRRRTTFAGRKRCWLRGATRRFHVGPAGSGAQLKLVVNLVLGLNRAVLAEGLSLAAACGIDPAAALEVLKATPAYSTVMDTKGARMIARDFEPPQARLAQHHKDVRLIRELARRHAARTPLSERA